MNSHQEYNILKYQKNQIMPLLFKFILKLCDILFDEGREVYMKYANWTTNEEMKKFLTPVNLKTGVKNAGIPMMYDDEYLYIDDRASHTLVIGSTGSGKTQSTILPITKLAMMANESIILNDVKGEIYKTTAHTLEKNGYKVIVLNFDKSNLGNSWNPLTLPYVLLKNDDKDKALDLVEDLGYYLFNDPAEKHSDPFWINSVIDFFTGITLYLIENAKEDEINLNSIYDFANLINNNPKEFLNKIDKTSNIYFNVSGTLNAPTETRGSILSVFNQKIKKYVCRENLSNMMATTDFDITNISNEKTAIFIVSGNSTYSSNLIPLFINQVYNGVDMVGNQEKTLNILLDEFDTMLPIKDFSKLIHYSRSLKIRFVVAVKSYMDLMNIYGKENAEILKMCFANIIYLLSNDIYTLEEISSMCGMNSDGESLITVEDLKTMKIFEAIILSPRNMPFKTKLLPNYQIDWGFEAIEKEIPKRNKNIINIYEGYYE